ncbi:MAG: hypothetical protein SFU56_00165 [Capsulimonadales bacterium]|nr:hypothetical protein [Capsulimonadales bacterium]
MNEKSRFGRKWWIGIAVGCLLLPGIGPLTMAVAQPPESEIMSEEIPELTEELFEQYSAYARNLLDIKLSASQRETQRKFVENYWMQGRSENIRTVVTAAQLYRKVMNTPADVRLQVFAEARGKAIPEIRKAARQGDPESKWLEELVNEQHGLLVAGEIPLTCRIVDDNLEMDRFHREITSGERVRPMSAAEKRTTYQAWAKVWPSLPMEKRRSASEMQGKPTVLKLRWNRMGAEDRLLARYRMTGGKNMTAEERTMVQNLERKMAGMMRSHANTLLNNELQFMKQNQSIIMSSGTYWNPSANRWEQHGGIVTEFQ